MKMLYDRKFDIIEMPTENAMQVFVNVPRPRFWKDIFEIFVMRRNRVKNE